MAKFKKKSNTSQEIPTSALPDIIFMLLFFFMVVTVMRDSDLLVKNNTPDATQLQKLEKKSLISHIYIGEPLDKYKSQYGTSPRIQVNDVIIQPVEIGRFVAEEKDKLDEAERDKIIMSLHIDREAKMGIVNDVKLQLREVNALKVNYAVKPGSNPI